MTRVPPPLLALAAALAQRAIAGTPPAPSRRRTALTTVVSLASVAMAGAAGSRFRRTGTTLDPVHPEAASTLVTTGANSVSRNPMYVGLAGLLVGHAIWRRSAAALLPAAAFVVVVDRVQVAAEEAALATRFGAAYEAYRATTPRWLDPRSFRGASGPSTS